MNKQQRNWFTLIELIVVVTILVILGTIAFISFNWFTKDARNSVRITEVDTLNWALALRFVETWVVPIPDNPITLSVENKDFAVQWDAWTTVSGVLKVSWELKDPLDWKYYPYITGLSRRWAQVATFLEDSDSDSKKPFFKGNNFWLILDENNNPIHKDTSVISSWKFDTLASWTAEKEIKVLFWENPLKMKAFMLWGQLSQATTGRSYAPPRRCPDNFIPVPWNKDLWQPGFCVWKYEASLNSKKFETIPWKMPFTLQDITSFTNSEQCAENWPWYHIMTLNERITIARNIEMVSSNWSSWVVWTGYVKGGYNWDSTTWITNNWDKVLITWNTWNSVNDLKRQLKLSNWEIIWDFIWNAWEIVDPLSYVDWTNWTAKSRTFKSYFWNDRISWSVGGYTYWSDITDDNFKKIYWPQGEYSNSANMWKVKEVSWDNFIYIVWGDSYSDLWWSQENGLYSFYKVPWTYHNNVWTRCSYSWN